MYWNLAALLLLAGLVAQLDGHGPLPAVVPDVPPGVPAVGVGSGSSELPRLPLLRERVFSDYAGVLKRPLFAPDRRPRRARVSHAPRGTLGQRYRLSGIVFRDGEGRAVLLDRKSRGTVELRAGMQFEGWRVEQITPERVRLLRDGQVDELLLFPEPDQGRGGDDTAPALAPPATDAQSGGGTRGGLYRPDH